MDSSRRLLLLLIFMVITTSRAADTAEPKCKNSTLERFNRLEGEAFYFQPYNIPNSNIPDENITWYKSNSNKKEISNEEERVHYHRGALFFLNLEIEDSGFYTARHYKPSGKCYIHHLELAVFDKSQENKVFFITTREGFQNIRVSCPDIARETCEILDGQLTWEKDSKALYGEHTATLWLENANKSHEGNYTCICTWKHNQKEYKTTASRKLVVEAPVVHQKLVILSPTTKEQFADEGVEIKLNCSVRCGKNVGSQCRASWLIDGNPINPTDGYNVTTQIGDLTDVTIATAILTIEKVSAKDFQAEFMCKVDGLFETVNSTLTLKPGESVTPLIIAGLSVLFFCVFVAVVIKYFAIDLALFFRPYLPLGRHDKDARVYDAYVIYQMQDMDKESEDILCCFVTKNLPSVLEEKCGYRLFIHGRDDIPGEDRLELVEDRMKQSRRLMVVLTPGSGSSLASPQNSVIGGFDWQVGLHHALVQREMSVILIQLGDAGPQRYSHLPPGLQHLIQKSAPIRWQEDSRGASAYNSCFWKRVRYLMPATPTKKSLPSSIV
uniref:interleukin-1 receptor-like 1 n=1 Tax=Semicossyphus pulcher TaxID=241346 RepID=UPI0037E9907A